MYPRIKITYLFLQKPDKEAITRFRAFILFFISAVYYLIPAIPASFPPLATLCFSCAAGHSMFASAKREKENYPVAKFKSVKSQKDQPGQLALRYKKFAQTVEPSKTTQKNRACPAQALKAGGGIRKALKRVGELNSNKFIL